MELILVIILCIILALGVLLDKATHFIKQLQSKGSAKLSKGFEAKVSVVPIDNKKSEDVRSHKPH